ncbi:MAG TPA: S1/P1 nuclease [Pirellulales bacterium]|jgi:hypothetical protein|nr:S1/P1 nuclease [Pirellulales bacterium]
MIRRLRIAIVGLVLLIRFAPSALAWNETGHMTVALIAYRRLSTEQKRHIAEILKAHPHYESLLLDSKPDDVDAAEWVFMRAAVWPDLVRPDRSGNKPESITKYHHGPWHYVDFPFVAPKDKDTIDAAQLKPNDPSLLTALPDCVLKFSHSDSTNEEKAINLCWILHLVGDVHQPLHCISLYNDENRRGDMGGNALAVRSHGTPTGLHAYWDDLLGTGTTYVAIDQIATTITASSVHDPDKMPELKKHPTVASWAAESHELAVALAYLNGKLKTASWRGWENREIQLDDIPELPEGYEANAREVACRRVALAGYRLADLLSQSMR